MIYLCILVHACSVWCRLVYLLFPVYPVCEYCLVLPCPAMSCLDVLLNIIIWVYILVCVFLFLPRVCTVTEDQTKTVSGAILFSVFKSFYFVPVFVYVCPAAWKSPLVIPAIAHCKLAWEFGRIAANVASPLAASPHARRSWEISVAGGGSPKPAGSLPSSRVAAPPGAPFAGDHATGSPLTQCPPARLWLNARRPASDSMPAGPPLSQSPPDRGRLNARRIARRIAADSSPPDCRWLKPTGSALIHARWPPLSLAPWIKSTCHG